ncbi:phosphoribosyltransferase [Winogradskyella pacifica]|uniref:phosphoribosyltransferase n=1 Tax=Winogradskyella pacifica TaxID=664642 RepID=UPI0015CBEDC6|nr:phosphoribosyltransferase [Winogradskyella pacifica]
MNIKFSKKFSDKHLDEIINRVYNNFKIDKDDKYIFDLTETEYIANQELLVLSSLFSIFVNNDIEFEVLLFKKGVSTNDIPTRVRKQIIELWTVWEIWQIIPNKDYIKYFGLDGKSIEILQREDNYYPLKAELYGRYGITPFITLDFINNYDANEIQLRIERVFKLSDAIEEILKDNNCIHPFTSNSLSSIISEELYLNFLDHSLQSAFKDFSPFSALSISFKKKYRDQLKYQNKNNFETEQIPETKSFFYNSETKEFHNRGYIEFSFLDFGSGIPETLRSKSLKSTDTDNDILKFAFQHNSSRHPITIIDDKPEEYIPRGLFDALTIVRRYKGLLIARSNSGKILYDFSKTDNIEKAYKTFGNTELFFPGTLISLYIPAIENKDSINESSIKPETSFEYIKPKNKIYVNLNEVLKDIPQDKKNLYSLSLQALRKAILFDHGESTVVYLSFLGCKIEDRVARKILVYLITDYEINIKTNVVIIHGPKVEVVNSVSEIINSLSSVYKNYKIHPLPIINYQNHQDEIHIQWLGVYDKLDIEKLNELLLTEYSIAKSDFNDPSNIEGHILSFDTYGNLQSNLPNEGELIKIFKEEEDYIISANFLNILIDNEGIVKDNGEDLYLCNGNYYQKEYIEINNIINSREELENLTNLFFKKLQTKIDNIDNVHFIGITSTSNKMLQSLLDLNLITKEQHWSFDNYDLFNSKANSLPNNSGIEYILICDVISTGFLTKKIENRLTEFGAKLNYVGVLVSVIDVSFRNTDNNLDNILKKTISLLDYRIDKYEAVDIKDDIISKNIIRINPYTNIPIRLSYEETNYNDSIIFHSEINYNKDSNEIIFENEFLDTVEEENLKVGYYKFNNVIHPYFFDTTPILENLKVDLIKSIFDKINKSNLKSDKVQVFYPRDSGIKSDIFFTNIKSGLGNDNIEVIEIDRINTNEGWRFPHNSKHLSSKVDDKLCLIIDDGSSTGDSLIQMIDEISFYNAKEIILLCFIGRVNDHKREFFSRLTSINVQKNTSVDLSIYFATHWHIPTYYLDSNPISKETNWLKELISISNTPNNVKRIAKKILEEIEPKDDNFKDYKYLPKIKGTNLIPKKELIKRREEIGKVIGYRLYKESFTYFDSFIKKYSQDERNTEVNRYKEIELICGCIVYEPYLYDKLAKILPDVTNLIEQFVKYLVYSYDNYEIHKAYDWDKKDVIHLFFVVFKEDKLFTELTNEKFIKLIKFTQPKESSLDYILYKLTRYLPLKKVDLNTTKFDLELTKMITKLIDAKIPHYDILKQYFNFISTLPSRDDFGSQLINLLAHYKKQQELDLHSKKEQFGHYVSKFSSKIGKLIATINKKEKLLNDDIKELKKQWMHITEFITPILNFTSSFPDILTPYPYFELYKKIEEGSSSVRSRIGFINDYIYIINTCFTETETLEIMDLNIKKIQEEVDEESILYKLISNSTTNLKEFIEDLITGLKNEKLKVQHNELLTILDVECSIPSNYTKELIIEEIIKNMVNHSISENEIMFTMKKESDTLSITIKNDIKPKDFSNSTREGIRCLKNLSESNIYGFSYENQISKNQFTQTLKFTINGYK